MRTGVQENRRTREQDYSRIDEQKNKRTREQENKRIAEQENSRIEEQENSRTAEQQNSRTAKQENFTSFEQQDGRIEERYTQADQGWQIKLYPPPPPSPIQIDELLVAPWLYISCCRTRFNVSMSCISFSFNPVSSN